MYNFHPPFSYHPLRESCARLWIESVVDGNRCRWDVGEFCGLGEDSWEGAEARPCGVTDQSSAVCVLEEERTATLRGTQCELVKAEEM